MKRKHTNGKGIAKKIAAFVLAGITVRLLITLGVGETASSLLREIGENETLAKEVISFELGRGWQNVAAGNDIDDDEVLSEWGSITTDTTLNADSPFVTTNPTPEIPYATSVIAENVLLPSPKPHNNDDIDAVPNMEIINYTSYEIDVNTILTERPAIQLSAGEPQILIIHTHGSEAYSETEGSRTLDKSRNVVKVGDVLTEELESMGFIVIHDRDIYDYPSYSGSYGRTYDAVQRYLEDNPSIQIVIDLHRDSITAADGTKMRTEFETNGIISSKLMVLISTGEAGLEHPNWRENLRFGLRLQNAMDEAYPGLTRPVCISAERYNQHLAPGYIILEVGTDGNTVDEACLAARLFAKAAESTIKDLFTE